MVFIDYDIKVENVMFVICDGYVVFVVAGGQVLQGVVEVEVKGKVIYFVFIDFYSDYGMLEFKVEGKFFDCKLQMLFNKEGAYSWNEVLKFDFEVYVYFNLDVKVAKILC